MSVEIDSAGLDSGTRRRLRPLFAALIDAQHNTRVNAVFRLHGVVDSGKLALATVEGAFQPGLDSPPLALLVATGLAALDPVRWGPRLHALLTDGLRNAASLPHLDYWRVEHATRTLARHAEPEVIASLRESATALLRDGTLETQPCATAVLAGLLATAYDEASLRPLEALLSDPRVECRKNATFALRRAGTPVAVAAIARHPPAD